MTAVKLEIEYYPDPSKGRPVFFGSIFVGEPNTDPEVLGNQKSISIIQEDGTAVSVSQPVLTGAGGVPMFQGSPVKINVSGSYSLKVLNKKLEQVYFISENDGSSGVSVADFGVLPGGTTDNFAGITAANNAATADGVALFFPDGVYAIDLQVGNPLLATTSWFSDGGATLQNTNLGLTSDADFIVVDAQNDLNFSKIHLDGQITITGSGTPNLDQPTPSDANVDDYTRCAGWNVKNASTNINFVDCHTDNIYRASFRSESSSKGITHTRGITNRNRGTFGDPFYSQVCRNVTYTGCRAFDFTRIGFVYEGVAGVNEASDFCNITDCYAEFAHDNVSTENACGFWVENGTEINILGCHAVNTVGGFVLAASDSAGDPIANGGVLSAVRTYNLTNCIALSVKGGLNINPAEQNCVFNITNFNGHIPDLTDAQFNGTAGQFSGQDVISIKLTDGTSVINIENCGGFKNNSSAAAALNYGFIGIVQALDSTAQNVIHIKNCAFTFQDPVKVRTDANSGLGKGFLHGNSSIGPTIHMSDCVEIGALLDALSIHMTSYTDKGELYINNCRPQIIDWNGRSDKLHFSNCPYIDFDVQCQINEVKISDSTINLLNVRSNNVKLHDCDVSQVSMLTVDPHTRHDGFYARGCTFNGDLGVVDTCTFQVADSRNWRAGFSDCEFFNLAGATNTSHFIKIDTAFGFIMGSGNLIDDRITNYMERNAVNFSAPKTDVDTDMPFGIFTTLDS
ncbi:MAG: phage tailspike protein [Nitrosomonadaceae bacterium]